MSLFERIKNKRLSLQEKKDDKTDKGIKQSEVSKQAKKFTRKINQKNINRPEGIIGDTYVSTDKKGNIRSAKKVNPTLKKSVSQVKADIEFKQGIQKVRKFSGQKGTGELSDKAPGKVRKFVQDTRAKRIKDLKLPDTSFDSKTKFSQKQFEKPLKQITKGPGTGIVDPFKGSEITKGQANVKGLESKAFKKTQPRDIKKTKEYKPYEKLSKDIKKLKTDVAKTASAVKKSNVSKKRTMPTGRQFISMYGKKGSVTNPEISGIDFEKTPSSVRSGTKSKGSSNVKVNTGRPKVTKNYTRKDKGFKNPIKTKASKPSFDVSGTKYNPLKGPELPKFVTAKGDASFSKTGAGKDAIRIQKRATRSDINILKAGQKIARKSGPAKGLVKTGSKILSKLGPKGRLAAVALTGFAASPFGRKTIGTLATAGGLTALFGGGKKEKQLKVGDGLKNVGKVRVTADSKGLKRNQADMAKIKATQKNFIDKYNKGRTFGKIKYNVNKQGTYDVIKPKKK